MITTINKPLKIALLRALQANEIDLSQPEFKPLIEAVKSVEAESYFKGFDSFMAKCRTIKPENE